MNKKTYLHSTLIKYKDLLKPKHFLKCNNIYIPLWLNIKVAKAVTKIKKAIFTFHSD